MKLTKMIYLASPYTYKHAKSKSERKRKERQRAEEITKIAGQLEDIYPYAFILPITMSHNTAKYMKERDGEFAYWQRRDLTYIAHCDEVWVATMDGWNQSVGVRAEIEFAQSMTDEDGDSVCPVKYVDPFTLKITKRPLK